MYKCISFLEKSDDPVAKHIELQFDEYFNDMDDAVIDNTQVVSTTYVNSKGETVYQDIMYVWYHIDQ